jgi:hypothetical protein
VLPNDRIRLNSKINFFEKQPDASEENPQFSNNLNLEQILISLERVVSNPRCEAYPKIGEYIEDLLKKKIIKSLDDLCEKPDLHGHGDVPPEYGCECYRPPNIIRVLDRACPENAKTARKV